MRPPGARLCWPYTASRFYQQAFIFQHPPRPRLFTSNAPLLALARQQQLRPQLPFLAIAIRSRPYGKRLLSTEVRENFKYQIKLGIYWSLIGWVVIGGFFVAGCILHYDWRIRQFPAPPEWHWFIKLFWQDSINQIETEGNGRGMIDWASAGTGLRAVVLWLEDFPSILELPFFGHTSTGVVKQDQCDSDIPGIDPEEMQAPFEPLGLGLIPTRLGCDVTMKSEQWRRGYFEAYMGLAKAAEMRTGYMTDLKTNRTFAPEHVRSPSNPYPKPFPQVMGDVRLPDIEDCAPSMEPADFVYKRILTTKGFSRKQRMDAGIAYATWLEQCGKGETAERLYHWALGLALEGVPEPKKIVNHKSGTILADAPFVTANILQSCTALAGFQARAGNIQAALPVFLSVLRARQSAPAAPAWAQYPTKAPDYTITDFGSAMRWVAALPTAPEYPNPPPDGDEPFERAKSTSCEEAALMAHVGEVLFAKSNNKRQGLALTRQATQIAEAMVGDERLDKKATKTCEQCFRTGLDNWRLMVQKLADEQAKMESDSAKKTWLSLGGGLLSGEDGALLQAEDWADEKEKVTQRLMEVEEKHLNDRLNAYIKGQSSWFVV